MAGPFKPFEGRDAKTSFLKKLETHRQYLKKITPSIDNRPPDFHFHQQRPRSPRVNQDKMDSIAHNNLKLANRIFDIMEGPGLITDILKQKETDSGNHPGTLNFEYRVREAARIHKQNISLAMRLDNVRPYYGKLFTVNKPGQSSKSPRGSPTKADEVNCGTNTHGVPKLVLPKKLLEDGAAESALSNKSSARKGKQLSARLTNDKKPSPGKNNGNNSARKNNVLLEYSKIQNGRVLDVAVIKEPFQDRYAIFGIDIDNGLRYELRLTSDEVSSILDGDILVTSLDNVEVWLALLNKVTLQHVEAFSKLSHPSGGSPAKQQPADVNERIAVASSDYVIDELEIAHLPVDEVVPVVLDSPDEIMEPEAPAIARPTTRPGGRGSRSQTRHQAASQGDAAVPAPSADIYDTPPDDNAAVKIQSLFRGKQARTEVFAKKKWAKSTATKTDEVTAASPVPPKQAKEENKSTRPAAKGKGLMGGMFGSSKGR